MDPLHARALADPDDNDLRTVWADALLERGDPLGELIALQLASARAPLTRPQDQRLRSLIAEHRGAWLGELAPIAMHRDGLVFDRGLLAECHIQVKQVPALAKVVGHPSWAALRLIWFRDKFAWDERIVPLLTHPVMRGLREVWCVGMNGVFTALARHPRPLPFTSMWTIDDSYRSPSGSFFDLREATALPQLKRLGFTIQRDTLERVLAHPIVAQLDTLALTCRVSCAEMIEATRKLHSLTTLELRQWWIPIQGPQRPYAGFRFMRGRNGAWSRLVLELVGSQLDRIVAEEIEALPATALEHAIVPEALVKSFQGKFKRAEIAVGRAQQDSNLRPTA